MASTSQSLRGKRACKKIFWAVFPHVCFILSLVIYAFLGALMFSHIEGNRKVNLSEEYRTFLQNLWHISRNLSGTYWNFKITSLYRVLLILLLFELVFFAFFPAYLISSVVCLSSLAVIFWLQVSLVLVFLPEKTFPEVPMFFLPNLPRVLKNQLR